MQLKSMRYLLRIISPVLLIGCNWCLTTYGDSVAPGRVVYNLLANDTARVGRLENKPVLKEYGAQVSSELLRDQFQITLLNCHVRLPKGFERLYIFVTDDASPYRIEMAGTHDAFHLSTTEISDLSPEQKANMQQEFIQLQVYSGRKSKSLKRLDGRHDLTGMTIASDFSGVPLDAHIVITYPSWTCLVRAGQSDVRLAELPSYHYRLAIGGEANNHPEIRQCLINSGFIPGDVDTALSHELGKFASMKDEDLLLSALATEGNILKESKNLQETVGLALLLRADSPKTTKEPTYRLKIANQTVYVDYSLDNVRAIAFDNAKKYVWSLVAEPRHDSDNKASISMKELRDLVLEEISSNEHK